ncbi:hypothetical protein [Tardiphaga sp. 709]|uniref:hypothetical protein n=1 Tax=Tardiphaga sp. 709 TaxID=3076039 RepID=UPI0028E2FC92|nr:hypothetical protein [Tardiphaga sp. 709]WNV10179.1 hypothetical protein RSO67_03000 [Tardiphaga sp. 709]
MSTAAAEHRVEYEDITSAMRLARSNVANARLWAFEDEAFRMASIIYDDPARRRCIVDFLEDLATANGLVRCEGPGLIQRIICAALRGDA